MLLWHKRPLCQTQVCGNTHNPRSETPHLLHFIRTNKHRLTYCHPFSHATVRCQPNPTLHPQQKEVQELTPQPSLSLSMRAILIFFFFFSKVSRDEHWLQPWEWGSQTRMVIEENSSKFIRIHKKFGNSIHIRLLLGDFGDFIHGKHEKKQYI